MTVFLRSMLCERSHVLLVLPYDSRELATYELTTADLDRLLLQECREALRGAAPECEHCVSKTFSFESERTSARSVAEISASIAVLNYAQEMDAALTNVNDLYEVVETFLRISRTDAPPSPRDRWIKSMMLLELQKLDASEVAVKYDFAVMSLACVNRHVITSIPLKYIQSESTDPYLLEQESLLEQERIERIHNGRSCATCSSQAFHIEGHPVPVVSLEDLRVVLDGAIALNIDGTLEGLYQSLDIVARTRTEQS